MTDDDAFLSNTTVLTSFENLCRICSKWYDKAKLVNLFGESDTLEKVASCLPISIHEGDNLPHHVCESCLKLVESSFQLVNKAQSSEKYFFDILNSLESGSILKIKEEQLTNPSEENQQQSSKKPALTLDLGGSFMCDICGIQLPEAEELDNHIQENHGHQSVPPNTEFMIHKICSLCGQLFEGDEAYVLHKCESRHKCTHCKKVMTTRCLLNRHIQHSCKPLYYCSYCHKTFSARNSFVKHVQVHTEQKFRTDCVACDRKHQGSHLGELLLEHTCDQVILGKTSKKYRCYICGQGYKRQLNLVKHCLQHEPENQWTFKCQLCDSIFEKEKILHKHYESVHKMPKTWICRFCGKSLSTKLSLQIHERIHTQVKPFVCEWCGNAFRCKPNLIQHQAIHTGIRRHKCNVCGKMFSRPFFLQTHMRVHTGERPYVCDICGQRFTQPTDMRRHQKRHEKESNKTPKVEPETMYVLQNDIEEFPEGEYTEVIIDDCPIETVELKVETSYE